MGTSERDKDLWKLKQLHQEKSALFTVPCTPAEESKVRNSDEYRRIQAEFDTIFAKYGFNPEIFKERSGSKRDVLLKIKDAVRRNEKRSSKHKELANIKSELDGDSD
jgi:hypothetical protein